MKKIISIFVLTLSLILLTSCGLPLSSKVINNKKEIVEEKYGNIEYITEGIIVYKNLSDIFEEIEGITNILKNKGKRGSVEPEFRENFYLFMNIVKHDLEYKVLIYDTVIKRGRDETKMFVLTNYFLPIDIKTVNSLLDDYSPNQNITKFEVSFLMKDSNIKNPIFSNNDISKAYYNKLDQDDTFMEFYDYESGNVIIGEANNLVFGNVKDKKIFYPSNIKYDDYIKSN